MGTNIRNIAPNSIQSYKMIWSHFVKCIFRSSILLKKNHCKFCNDTWKWVCFSVAFIRKLPFLRNLNIRYGEIQSFLLGGLLMCGREACWWGRGWERGGEWRRGGKRRHQEMRGRISEWTCFYVGLIVRKQLPQCALRWELTLVNSLL